MTDQLQLFNGLRSILRIIEAQGNKGNGADEELIGCLESLGLAFPACVSEVQEAFAAPRLRPARSRVTGRTSAPVLPPVAKLSHPAIPTPEPVTASLPVIPPGRPQEPLLLALSIEFHNRKRFA
jgi:hypothetical protein